MMATLKLEMVVLILVKLKMDGFVIYNVRRLFIQ